MKSRKREPYRSFLKKVAKKNCELCEGSGIKFMSNGPDDYWEESCPCTKTFLDTSGADGENGINR